jgi:hypothetical protein
MSRSSPNYLFTVDHRTPAGQLAITQARVKCRMANKNRPHGTAARHIAIYPRLGEDNPHAPLYRDGGPLHTFSSQRIKREHGQYADVYAMPDYNRLKGFKTPAWKYGGHQGGHKTYPVSDLRG